MDDSEHAEGETHQAELCGSPTQKRKLRHTVSESDQIGYLGAGPQASVMSAPDLDIESIDAEVLVPARSTRSTRIMPG